MIEIEFLKKDIRYVKGVGEARAKLLNKLGIYCIEDMLYYFPRDYEDRSKVKKVVDVVNGENVCITIKIFSKVTCTRIRKGLNISKVVAKDDSGAITAIWYNQNYISKTIRLGETYLFYGKISTKYEKREIINPIFEKLNNNCKYVGKVVPLYHLTFNLTQKIVQNIILNSISLAKDSLIEFLPRWILKKYNLKGISYCINNIHFPKNKKSFIESRNRLVFEELLLLQLALLRIKKGTEKLCGISLRPQKEEVNELIKHLPFTLTKAQIKVINEIQNDLQADKPMSRLVQGDVGSGKTIVALIAMYICAKNNYQAVLMAPTEILAEQHYKSFNELLKNEHIKISLLTGSMNNKQKQIIRENIKNGNINLIIGTHALIQDKVEFNNLGLVITDEQHRFGVKQRVRLASKGINPHVLVMTATPIPRTLALILYGDLDISIIDEFPPGRKKVKTYAVSNAMRNRINNFLKKQLNMGRQIYIVCPLIEESETIQLKSAIKYAEELNKVTFKEYSIGLLHGKLKAKEKEKIMRKYINKEIDILVSTTVIEVGVNVPNASVIVIENAERFGLSQLHQLRGRVGRGEYQSYCILYNNSNSFVALQRMKIMQETSDGFKISERDLQLRGPGEFFGTRQHGLPDLKIANLFTDVDLLKLAQQVANEILIDDPDLQKGENTLLKKRSEEIFLNKKIK